MKFWNPRFASIRNNGPGATGAGKQNLQQHDRVKTIKIETQNIGLSVDLGGLTGLVHVRSILGNIKVLFSRSSFIDKTSVLKLLSGLRNASYRGRFFPLYHLEKTTRAGFEESTVARRYNRRDLMSRRNSNRGANGRPAVSYAESPEAVRT